MIQWLTQNGFKQDGKHYYLRGLSVILSNSCLVIYEGEIVWRGDIGQDAIGVISEYLDL